MSNVLDQIHSSKMRKHNIVSGLCGGFSSCLSSGLRHGSSSSSSSGSSGSSSGGNQQWPVAAGFLLQDFR